MKPPIPLGLHRGDLGRQRGKIAPLLTGEDLAELLALADFCVSCGGSLNFGRPSDLAKRLKTLRLVEWVPQPELSRGTKLHRLTMLGWLTLLTRAEHEMRHLLAADEIERLRETVPTQRGIKCGLCGMKFDYGKAIGYYCSRAHCPVQIKAT